MRSPDNSSQIAILIQNPAEIARGAKLVDLDPNGDAGAAMFACRPVGDCLRTAESRERELIVERDRAAADQMGEDLAFVTIGKIGAGRRRRQIKLRCVARFSRQTGRPFDTVFILLDIKASAFWNRGK